MVAAIAAVVAIFLDAGDAIASDVAAAYREARKRFRQDYPAYETAVKVYLGHRPNVADARAKVAEIIARDADERARWTPGSTPSLS